MIAVDALGSVANIVAPVDLSGATQVSLSLARRAQARAVRPRAGEGIRAAGAEQGEILAPSAVELTLTGT